MPEKPTRADGYRPEFVERVRRTCLYVATKLGDLTDDVVVVGGLVPTLLVDQASLPAAAPRHVGTMDLDIGLTVALLEERRYTQVADRLRRAGFSRDTNAEGNPTHQRWKIEQDAKVTVDFLIQPTLATDKGGRIRHLEHDLAAVIVPGLHLAFRDQESIELSGQTIMGEQATRRIRVCGAGAYTVLKALAFRLRGENKDAYDLFYVLQNHDAGVHGVAARVRTLLDDPHTRQAIDVIRQDFLDQNGLGPRRVAEFQVGRPDEVIQADVAGHMRLFLQRLQ